jgi:uncharacterized membrane protein (DUF485 family)
MPEETRVKQPGTRVDWEGIEGSPEFRELVAARKRLISPLLVITVVAITIYTILLLTSGDGFLSDSFIGEFTWGLLLIVLMTVLIFVLAAIYSRVSIQKLDPLVERARRAAVGHGDASSESRFTR